MKQKSNKYVSVRSTHPKPSNDNSPVLYVIFVIIIACVISILHRNHLAYLHENDRGFSHLSTLERELSFRTEMGLYYSYFKTIIEAPSFISGVGTVMKDNLTEYPDTINTLHRFNLYPEVVLGFNYRIYQAVMTWLNIPTMVCWNVNRGDGLSPVLSCEGLGEPPYFYIEGAFLLNGIMMGIFFIFGTYLSGSVVGGFLTVVSFFYNHSECTRVQWTPPLRESFGYPFFVIQMLIVTATIRSPRPTFHNIILICIFTICFMLPWQFAQFALLTQTVAIFGVYVLEFIGSHKVKVIIAGQLIGSVISTVLLFGNKMMISSYFVSCVITVWVIVSLESKFEKLGMRVLIWACQIVALGTGTILIKCLTSALLSVTDDAHISEILRSKFSNFRNFHTMLYTCAPEFDFMEVETPARVLKTLLAPGVLVVIVVFVYKILCNQQIITKDGVHDHVGKQDRSEDSVRKSRSRLLVPVPRSNKQLNIRNRVRYTVDMSFFSDGGRTRVVPSASGDTTTISGNGSKAVVNGALRTLEGVHRYKEHAEVLYNVFQLLIFAVLAVIIMRLKLFWTPHMCLMMSLLSSRKLFDWVGTTYRHNAAIAVLVALMSVQGISNLQYQWAISGQYLNIPMEQLFEWVNKTTLPSESFAGPMSLMANLKLSTGRPIVNHPHYEDAALRARTMKVYSLFSRKPDDVVWSNMRELNVDYAIVELAWCSGYSGRGCSMAEIWDVEDVANRGLTPACERLYVHPEPYFERVFRNEQFDVLKVIEEPLREQNRGMGKKKKTGR